MNITPVRTKRDYEAALKEIDKLWGAKLRTPRGNRLEVLVTLVTDYEKRHYPMAPPDPIDAILFRMDQMGLTRKDLEPALGSSSRVSEVLRRKRPLTLPMIRRLHQQLDIPAESLIAA